MSGGGSLREVLGGVEAASGPLRDLLGTLLGGQSWRVPERDLLDALGSLHRLRGLVDAAHLRVVREIDARGVTGAVGSAPVATTTEGLVREVTGAGPGAARRDVAAARATGPADVLAGFAEHLADGRVRREHVDVAVRCLDRIPGHLVREPAEPGGASEEGAGVREIVAGFLLRIADTRADDRTLDRHARQLLAHLAPDPQDRVDPEAPARRFLDLGDDETGMVTGRFALDPVAGAELRVALAEWSAPEPLTDADGHPLRDPRTPRQRRADALSRLVEAARGISVPRRGERPRVVVHAAAAQLADAGSAEGSGCGAGSATTESGDPVPAWVLGRLACDAVLQRVVDDPSLGPLDVGREHRLVTLAQRRALAARDHGCVVCGAPPDWCDAHHVIPWSHGGTTDLANLALLCPGHHTAVHAGTWTLHRDPDGHLVLVPPRHVDPTRTPRRPTAHLITATLSEVEQVLRDHAERSMPLRT
ncbi:MAG: DUF222 domain-containing protein [Kineosporiaceae bacterium]